MKTSIPYIITAFTLGTLLSCENEVKTEDIAAEPVNVTTIAEKDGVYFESWIKPSQKPKTMSKKTAYVYYDLHISYENKSKDTVYYLSTTCSGDANLIGVKDKSILIGPRELCDVTSPKVSTIAPHKKEHVILTIGALENKHALDYSFYFRKVDSGFNADQLSMKGPDYSKKGNFIKFKSKLHPVPQD